MYQASPQNLKFIISLIKKSLSLFYCC